VSTRVTNEMVSSSTLSSLNSAQLQLARSERELSSGKRINEPSDDPVGSSEAITLQSALDGLGDYEKNANDGVAWLNAASGALTSIGQLTQRARELVLQASNGIDSQSDLDNIAAEVEQIAESVKQTADTQYAGQYVFSGTSTATPPYQQGASDAYAGNSGSITRAAAPGASVTVNVDLQAVLGEGQAAGDGKLLDTLRTVAAHLREGGASALQALSGEDLGQLDANVSALSSVEAQVGATTDQLNAAVTRIEDLTVTTTTQLSNVADTNFTQVAIEYSNQRAGYEAALRAGASIIQQSLLEFLH
jgi:flagellar hook-associated protein 3 FlgL